MTTGLQQRNMNFKPNRGGDLMFDKMVKKELLEDSYSPSPRKPQRQQHETSLKDNVPAFAWKKIILEISQKQGYTGMAL